MKTNDSSSFSLLLKTGTTACLLLVATILVGQMPPPGYERAIKMRDAEKAVNQLDRDSITVTDTIVVFDPTTYQETTTVTVTNYSLRDFCKNFLGMPNPDILLDGAQHTIIDPKTYEEMIIRLNPNGVIDTIPK